MSTENPDNIDPNPSYDQLESGELGHVQAIQIVFDPSKLSYKDLCKFFFTIHDPTTFGHQGLNIG